MKFSIIVFCIILTYTYCAQGLPFPASLCSINNDDATTCAGCYNGGAGTLTMPAKRLDGTTCGTLSYTIANCQYYNPTITSTKAVRTDCYKCSVKWMEISYVAGNTATSSVSCTATNPTGAATGNITDCDTNGYLGYRAAATGNFAAKCRWCVGKDNNGANFDENIGGADACGANASTIGNCTWTDPFRATGALCYECANDFTMNNARGACAAFTSNRHCGRTDATNAWCAQCKDGYYFNKKYCVKGNVTTSATATNANLNCMATWLDDGECLSCRNDGQNSKQFDETTQQCDTRTAGGITNCKYYNPQGTTAITLLSCMECENGMWLNTLANPTVISCDENPWSVGTCTATTNCAQNMCTFDTTYKPSCLKCNSGYYPSGAQVAISGVNVGGTSCVNTAASLIAQCSTYDPFLTSPLHCYLCNSGYIVAAAQTTCVTLPNGFTDTNCRVQAPNGLCGECKPGYIVNGTSCAQPATVAQGTPPATNFCMGNVDNSNLCSACQNHRAIGTDTDWHYFDASAGTCAVFNAGTAGHNNAKVADCLWYWGKMQSNVKTVQNCGMCRNKTWMNIGDNDDHAAGVSVVCHDTPTNAASCDHPITNCDQSVCYTYGGNHTKGCKWCAKGYVGSGTNLPNVGYTACTTTGALTNCDYANPYNKLKCYLCAQGYAVAANETSCVTYDTDPHCRLLASGGWCRECKTNFIFDTTKCKLNKSIWQGMPLASQYCMGNEVAANRCTQCYNWGSGTISAKTYNANVCTDMVNAAQVTHCKWYKGDATTTVAVDQCGECLSKDYMNIDEDAGGLFTVACADAGTAGGNCTAKVTDCDQTACYKLHSGTATVFCMRCSTGKAPSGGNVKTNWSVACTAPAAAAAIANCSYYLPTDAGQCFECATGYAVASNGKRCATYTTDPNCRKLSMYGWCEICNNGHYFNGLTCVVGVGATQGSPAGASYCMGNNDGLTSCSACYNWGSGTIGARQLMAGNCSTAVGNKVTNCKWYNGKIRWYKHIHDCGECNSKKWLNIVDSATISSKAITCVDADPNGTCNANVTNCTQNLCFTASGGGISKGCALCASGYKGATQINATVGYYTTCTNTGIITNCSLANPIDATKCFECATGYAVSSAETACTAYTTDANCRLLANGGWCAECKNQYYFNATTCTLDHNPASSSTSGTTTSAKIMAVCGLIMTLFFFFN